MIALETELETVVRSLLLVIVGVIVMVTLLYYDSFVGNGICSRTSEVVTTGV